LFGQQFGIAIGGKADNPEFAGVSIDYIESVSTNRSGAAGYNEIAHYFLR
jgi:hypothetical protein